MELDGAVAGFIFTVMDAKRKTGEIGLNAVDPKLQGRGIGRAMHEFALNRPQRAWGRDCLRRDRRGCLPMHRRDEPMKLIGFDKAIPGLHLFKVL